jgi:hypothetical protein
MIVLARRSSNLPGRQTDKCMSVIVFPWKINAKLKSEFFLYCNAMWFRESPTFRSKYCPHTHGRKIRYARNYYKQAAWAFSELNRVTAQNIIVLFTVPAVITSNPTTFKTGLLRENGVLRRIFRRNMDEQKF